MGRVSFTLPMCSKRQKIGVHKQNHTASYNAGVAVALFLRELDKVAHELIKIWQTRRAAILLPPFSYTFRLLIRVLFIETLQGQDGLKTDSRHIHALHLRPPIHDEDAFHRAFADRGGRNSNRLSLYLLCHDHQLQYVSYLVLT